MWVSIQSERAVNNFTSRTKAPILEIEGAFLASQAIDTLHSLLKDSMITKTKQVSMLTWVITIHYGVRNSALITSFSSSLSLSYWARSFSNTSSETSCFTDDLCCYFHLLCSTQTSWRDSYVWSNHKIWVEKIIILQKYLWISNFMDSLNWIW
jgi:hypothetical protein